ncbi:hypothetical protein [Brevundimonas aurantiaca]|jgi:hypothetical protein|uniref:hypothetical protein n=1 Tax=Brevundimonas aurantiaca TaxID=74316 RepID=UPI00174AA7DE|nr:hypothetical protein [Brevundimonas aurantiaca]
MLAVAILAVAVLAQTPSAPDSCDYDKEAMTALSPDEFDQDIEGGWRALSYKPGCTEAAADLLAAYRTAHWGSLTPGELHVNYWHEGQLRASLDQRLRAKRLLLAGVNPAITSDGFQDYAIGTVAFLDNDREALQAARDRLAATPPPDNWAETVAAFRERFGVEMKWPMNLNVLDNMLACFGRSYDEAYEGCKAR